MTLQHLTDIDGIQKAVYDKQFHETLAALADKLLRFPEGCRVCVADGTPVGYMFSHPGRLNSPPGLNKILDAAIGAADNDCYFIHDIAVMRSHRRLGVARRFLTYALGVASTHRYTIVTLVSVQGTRVYWQSPEFRFHAVQGPKETLDYIRQSYGDAACYMVRRIA